MDLAILMVNKTYRVIAAIPGNRTHETVNIVTDSLAADVHKSVRTATQGATGAPPRNEYVTVQAGPTGTSANPPKNTTFRTIFISGYAGPQ
jgi:hypothetical protein